MPETGIDTDSVVRLVQELADDATPKAEYLGRLAAAGYVYVGGGFTRTRSHWWVDRNGRRRTGGSLGLEIDLTKELVAALQAGGIPPAAAELRVQGAIDKVRKSIGGGVSEVLFLPLVVPESQVESAIRILCETFTRIAGRNDDLEIAERKEELDK